MNKIRDIDSSFIYHNENFFLCHTLVFGKKSMNDSENAYILNATRVHLINGKVQRSFI